MPQKRLTNPKNMLFLLEADIHKTLRKTAFEAGLSMAGALREAVQLWLRKKATAERRSNGTVEREAATRANPRC